MRIEGLTVREVVRSARQMLEMSQTDLAKALGVTSAYVSMVESGRRYPRIRYQADIYWRLTSLIGAAAPGGKVGFYSDLIAIDLLEREPALFELLGGFFYKEALRGLGKEVSKRGKRSLTGTAAVRGDGVRSVTQIA